MDNIKYILFDAANTLIHKPDLWDRYVEVLDSYGYQVEKQDLMRRHKLISEVVKFPDVTSKAFYNDFNAEVLSAIGIIPDENVLDAIFEGCKYLPWQAFDDVKHLSEMKSNRLGVLSNFNTSLKDILEAKIPNIYFQDIFISEEEHVAKPDPAFFEIALEKIGLQPYEILYLGDSLKMDVVPALTLGLNTRLIDRIGLYTASEYHITSLSELKSIVS